MKGILGLTVLFCFLALALSGIYLVEVEGDGKANNQAELTGNI